MIADSSANYLLVLDHDSPASIDSTTSNPSCGHSDNPYCAAALTGVTTCGDITAFSSTRPRAACRWS